MIRLVDFNHLPEADAERELLRCCGSRRWAKETARARPFPKMSALLDRGDQVWESLSHEDWLEAFGHHPRIGEQGLREKWVQEEQKGIEGISEELLQGLLEGNRLYESRFNHIFLVCATGKSAKEMLTILHQRLDNDPVTELKIAAAEQAKITRLRLQKDLTE